MTAEKRGTAKPGWRYIAPAVLALTALAVLITVLKFAVLWYSLEPTLAFLYMLWTCAPFGALACIDRKARDPDAAAVTMVLALFFILFGWVYVQRFWEQTLDLRWIMIGMPILEWPFVVVALIVVIWRNRHAGKARTRGNGRSA